MPDATGMSKRRRARKYNRNLRDMMDEGRRLDEIISQTRERVLKAIPEVNVYDQPTRH